MGAGRDLLAEGGPVDVREDQGVRPPALKMSHEETVSAVEAAGVNRAEWKLRTGLPAGPAVSLPAAFGPGEAVAAAAGGKASAPISARAQAGRTGYWPGSHRGGCEGCLLRWALSLRGSESAGSGTRAGTAAALACHRVAHGQAVARRRRCPRARGAPSRRAGGGGAHQPLRPPAAPRRRRPDPAYRRRDTRPARRPRSPPGGGRARHTAARRPAPPPPPPRPRHPGRPP